MVVTAIEEAKDLSKFTLEELTVHLFYLMKHDSLKKKKHWAMLSALRLPSTEVEAEEDEVEEEEAKGL